MQRYRFGMGQYRECTACRARFIAQRVTRRFCSDACRNKWHRAVWNDLSGGRLSLLLRQVADTVDRGQAAGSQVRRLRALLYTYERDLMALDLHRAYGTKKRRPKASAAS
jgi:hypothetical protein